LLFLIPLIGLLAMVFREEERAASRPVRRLAPPAA